jgi:putative FmdB family regulatory protein
MTTYIKRCVDCNEKFEIEISYSDYDDAKIICPHCGGQRTISVISSSSVIFKGKGFTKSAKDTSGEERPFDG